MDEEARDRVVRDLYERLAPGGILLLGHSESLVADPRPYELHRIGGELVYRKPESAR
jgi:chemotaxis methyl-accepting protein methylase